MGKKKTGIIIGAGVAVCAGVVLFVIFGIHRHEWTAATCTEPETCVECGETRGEPLGHSWEKATCTLASTCSVCGETEGEPLGHDWKEATCTLASTCSVCGETEGEPLGHDWREANYQTASTCNVCGETEGDPLAGWFEENQLSCGEEEYKAYEYMTSTRDNPEEKSKGSIIMSDCRSFDSDEEHPALEGYEWIGTQFEVAFGDENSWKYGNASSWFFTDYYTPDLFNESMEESGGSLPESMKAFAENEEIEFFTRYTVNYNGENYDQCIGCFHVPVQRDTKYALYSMTIEAYFLVPEGYDGVVVAFFDPVLGIEENENENEETQEVQETNDIRLFAENTTCIRIKNDNQEQDFPQMAVISRIIPIQPGQTMDSESVIRSGEGYEAGFYGLKKVEEFENYDKDKIWDRMPSYEKTTLSDEIELMTELEIPEEEGIYEVMAAVRGENGNAVTAVLTILADGTAPKVHVPNEKVTLRYGDIFAPMDGIYGEDNVCPEEVCYVSINMEELQKLADGIQRGRSGSYKLTYYAKDLADNTGEKTINVTLSLSGSGGGNSSNAGNGSQQAGSGNAGQQNVTQNQFMENMAKDAFNIVNQYRADVGLGALAWNDSIYESAKIRAQELVTSFSHTRPSGESFFSVMSGFSTYGENIAYGQTSASQVCNAWYNSEGHRNNMLNSDFSQGAIACWYQNGTYYWVNLFGG